ncbi:MAG: hypothetical protein JW759_00050 [Candidatus Coatesbacteria bacterium]|nr:hypothetical protein [Candidatus Coatesbacteria bacterium]
MRTIGLFTFALLSLAAASFATWDDAAGRGLIPFWINYADYYTLLVFVNGWEESADVIYIRFYDVHGNWCSDPTGNLFSIRTREMLRFSTTQKAPYWIPTTGSYGYVKFRAQDGGHIHAWALICNGISGTGMVVPAYDQDYGF